MIIQSLKLTFCYSFDQPYKKFEGFNICAMMFLIIIATIIIMINNNNLVNLSHGFVTTLHLYKKKRSEQPILMTNNW